MIKAIRGGNFSGKSFYLKCFTRYPSIEVLEVINGDLLNERDSRKSIYLHPIPEYNFSDIFDTVYDELFQLKKENEIDRYTKQILKDLQFDVLYEQDPSSLSGGEKALLSVISSTIMNPKFLGIDNTLEQLDYDNKKKILKFLEELSIPEVIFSDNRLNEIDQRIYQIKKMFRIKEEFENKYLFFPINSSKFIVTKSRVQSSLVIEKITFSYPRKQIFKNLTLKIQSGTIYHLKGVNGSGKSTLSKILSGVLKPSKDSRIIFNGRIIKPYKEPGKYIGYCFQQADEQLFESTVAKELNITSSKDKYLIALAETFGLKDVLNIHPFDLPLSIRKRLSIAATLSVERPIYIIDEPTLFLDDNNIVQVAEIIKSLSQSGKIIILISHSESFINLFAELSIINL